MFQSQRFNWVDSGVIFPQRRCTTQTDPTMAKLSPLEQFTFDQPAMRPAWRHRFQRYRTVPKLDAEPEKTQVSTLIYVMGAQAENIFEDLNFADAVNCDQYDFVLIKCDEHFVPKRIFFRWPNFTVVTRKMGEVLNRLHMLYVNYPSFVSLRAKETILFVTSSWLAYMTGRCQRSCRWTWA